MVNYANAKLYQIVNSCNDKIYVGNTTVSLSVRMCQHRDIVKFNRQFVNELYADMKKFGIEYFGIVLIRAAPCNSIEELLREEYAEMAKIPKERLYNIQITPELNEETKQKIRIAQTGKISSEETKQKIRLANTGKVKSEETKQKLRLANRKFGSLFEKKYRFEYKWTPAGDNQKRTSKSFSFQKCGSREIAWELANDFRMGVYPDCPREPLPAAQH